MIFFITGVGSGIGKATCLNALSQNNRVVGLARNLEKAEGLLREAENLPGSLSMIYVNLCSDNLGDVVQSELKKLNIQTIDILVNVAGVLNPVEFQNFNVSNIEEVMRVNFIAPTILIKTLTPLLSRAKAPNIVNITSMSGFQGSVRFNGLSIYGASKAALGSLSESLSVELAQYNIRINALALGAVSTDMLKEAFPDFQAPISPNQMAEFIYSFATSGYKFYNGKILPVAVTNP